MIVIDNIAKEGDVTMIHDPRPIDIGPILPNKRPVQPDGFSLVEVLVAVLIFSFGLLGLAGLQLVGLKSTSSAGNRYEATFLA